MSPENGQTADLPEELRPEAQKAPPPPRAAASLAGLGLLIAFHCAMLAVWIHKDDRSPTTSSARHLTLSRDYKKLVAARDFKHLLYYDFKAPQPPVPPLYHLSVLYAADRPDPAAAALWVNCFYLALLCAALWGLGTQFLNGWTGLAAAVLFSCAADVQHLAREPNGDLALIAWVAAAYWAFFASDSFRRRGYSVLFGVLFALGMLTKWSAFSYFLPLLIPAAKALGSRRGRVGVVLAGASALCLMAPWYRAQWVFLLPRLIDAAFYQGGSGGVSPLAYARTMSYGLELPLFLASLYALVFNGRLRSRRGLAALLLWFAVPFVFWTLVPRYDARFMLPAMAPLAVLVAGLDRAALRLSLCGFALLAAVNFGFGAAPNLTLRVFGFPLTVLRSFPPAREDWKTSRILGDLAAARKPGGAPEQLAVIAEHPRFNRATFEWTRALEGLDGIRIRQPGQNVVEFSDFIVIKTSAAVPETITVQTDLSGTLAVVQEEAGDASGGWFRKGYEAMQRWNLPDGAKAVMFWSRRMFENPFRERTALFDYYKEGPLEGENMLVDLGEWDPSRGVHREVSVRAQTLAFGELKAHNVHLVMEDLTLLPIKKMEGVLTPTRDLLLNVKFMRMRRLRVLSGTIMEKDARKYLLSRPQITGLRLTDIKLGEKINVKGSLFNVVPVSAEVSARVRADGRGLDMELQSSRVAGIPMPMGLLLGEHIRHTLAFDMDLPFEVEVSPFNIAGGRVVIRRR